MTTKRPIEQASKGKTKATLDVRCGAAPCLETMRANAARSLRPAARGLALRCLSGLVVVTQTGDRGDRELYPGDEFRTSSRGLVVAWAIRDSGFIVRTDTGALGTRRAA